jgi:transcription elongation factor Elf1
MCPFRKKKHVQKLPSGPPCPHCRSIETRLIRYHGTDDPDYVKVWRGQRSFTYRCDNCGQDFYGEESKMSVIDTTGTDGDVIDDAEALHAAEEEVKWQGREEE